MILNLSDVLSEQHKTIEEDVLIEMERFGSKLGCFPIIEKEPLSIKVEHVKERELLITGKGKIVLEEMFHLLKRTDKWIVCEGVETKEMVDFLIVEGCDELQGFYYYKPMEQKKFEELIA